MNTSGLRGRFGGDVIEPSDPRYDDARRVWNGMIDRRPALVVRPRTADDVATAIRFGRDNDLMIAVRGGGHSIPGLSTCDDGLVIDLSLMRDVSVDPVARTARAAGGAHLSQLDKAAQEYRLVCPVGVVGHTGVAGLTLGGGMGRLQRKWGLTIDNLNTVELVTADGQFVRASATENPDLFWGLRGAGANFGVATAFEFGLHPFGPTFTRGEFHYPASQIHELWPMFREWARTAGDELFLSMDVSGAGSPTVSITVMHWGDPASVEDALSPMRAVRPPTSSSVGPENYLARQGALDEEARWGRRTYNKAGFANDLSAAVLDQIVDHVARGGNALSMWVQGGAMGRVPDEATAFTGRTALFDVAAEAAWDDSAQDEDQKAWIRQAWTILEPEMATGRYVNEIADASDERGPASIYGAAKLERLVALKRAWDPDNVFRLNQNIRP